jgi:hypothetical protein
VWYVWQRRGMYSKFWWRNLKDRNHLEVVSSDGRIIIKCTLKKIYRRAVTKLM